MTFLGFAASGSHVDLSHLCCHLMSVMSSSMLLLKHVWVHGPTVPRVSLLMSVAHVPIKGHTDVHGLGCNLNPC